jgi:hypothetical protein
MNAISLTILGREIFVLRLPEPAQEEPEPAPEVVDAEPEDDAQFGFHGGSRGIHQAAWSPTTPRPIEAH